MIGTALLLLGSLASDSLNPPDTAAPLNPPVVSTSSALAPVKTDSATPAASPEPGASLHSSEIASSVLGFLDRRKPHGSLPRAGTHLEVSWFASPAGTGFYYREKGSFLPQFLLSALLSGASQQAAASHAAPGQSYTYQSVAVSGPIGLAFRRTSVETAVETYEFEGNPRKMVTKTVTVNESLNDFTLFYQHNLPVKNLSGPVMICAGWTVPGALNLRIESPFPFPWATVHLETDLGSTFHRVELGSTANLTDWAWMDLSLVTWQSGAPTGVQFMVGTRI